MTNEQISQLSANEYQAVFGGDTLEQLAFEGQIKPACEMIDWFAEYQDQDDCPF